MQMERSDIEPLSLMGPITPELAHHSATWSRLLIQIMGRKRSLCTSRRKRRTNDFSLLQSSRRHCGKTSAVTEGSFMLEREQEGLGFWGRQVMRSRLPISQAHHLLGVHPLSWTRNDSIFTLVLRRKCLTSPLPLPTSYCSFHASIQWQARA